MKAEILTHYECPGCGTYYNAQKWAAGCCPNIAVEHFICSACKKVFKDKQEAQEHLELSHGEENQNVES